MKIPSRISQVFRLALLSLFLVTLTACDEAQTPPPEIVRPAKIITVGEGSTSAIRVFPGQVEASDEAVQAFRVPGELIELPVNAGQRVEQGQLLARLDPRDYELRYEDKAAKFDLANVQYKRAKELVDRKLIPIADFDKAKSSYLAAKADLDLAKSRLEYTSLKAPFDGVISTVMVDNHQNVQAKEPIMRIQSLDMIDISFQIPEGVVARLEKGRGTVLQPTVTFDSHPENEYTAAIKEFDTQPDPQTNTYRVRLTMDAPETFIALAGMTVSVTIDFSTVLANKTDVMVLPVESVFAPEDVPLDSTQRFVWKLEPQSMTVTRHPVTVGRITNAGIEITSGLEPGDQVIAAGVHFLKEGQKVRRLERERGL
jgi:RND family efflux transporter MFP subunit